MKPLFGEPTNNLFAVAMVAMLLIIVWYSVNDYSDFMTYQQGLAQRSVDNTAREIEVLISGRKDSVRLFANREQILLRKLIEEPGDVTAQDLLKSRVNSYFPTRLGVTVANEKGSPLLKQGRNLIGKSCRRDTALFIKEPSSQKVHVHPSPGSSRLHFDILSDTSDLIQDKSVFFVSFFLDDLFRVLNHGQVVGHQLVLVRTLPPEFIEAPTDDTIVQLERLVGKLDQLPSAKPSLLRTIWSAGLDEFVLATATVKGTQWELRGVAKLGLYEKRRNALVMQAATILLMFLMIAWAGLTLTRRLKVSRDNTDAVLLRIEDERKRIAMDLHDQVLSDISHIRRECQGLIGSFEESEQARQAGNIENDLNEVTNTIRHVINDLHPHSLSLLGFSEAVRDYCNKQLRQYADIEVTLNVEGWKDDRLDDASKLHLFRVFQETIDNVIRHSKATKCDIVLKMTERRMRLIVSDNGIGMTAPGLTLEAGHGIPNIYERCRMIGAKGSWQAVPGSQGTAFILEMPVSYE